MTIWDYDEVFIAPRHRFTGAEDYYERCKPLRFMSGVRVPTLILASRDDPWIPGDLYGRYGWWKNLALKPILLEHGGHVGFHGRDSKLPWTDRAVARFLAG
jgi:predicted alpha/beta-fold hydrolase